MLRPALIAALLLGGCSQSTGGDGGVDARRDRPVVIDARRERGSDARPDAPAEAAADASVLSDRGGGDARPTLATVLYTAAADPASFVLRTVSTSKPGSPSALPGWTDTLELIPLAPTGLREEVPVSPARPQITANQPSAFQGVRLPGGAVLFHVRRKLLGTSGLLLVGVDGSLSALREVPGLYQDTIGSHVALDAGGKLGAGLAGAAGVFLFRIDLQPFPGGTAPWKDISAAAATVAEVRARSLTFAGGWIYAVGSDPAGKDLLLRAPSDGSAALAPVSLPASNGLAPVSISDGVAASSDGKSLAVAAGASFVERDLYVIEAASAVAKNLTQGPGQITDRGDTFGLQNAQLALSPAGTLAAYLVTMSGNAELFVARTDGSTPPQQVSEDARFQDKVVQFCDLYFADDQNLIFLGGVSASQQDVYRWDNGSSQVQNLSGTGGKTAPFDGQGLLGPEAGWVSPSSKWLYLVVSSAFAENTDVLGVDLKAFGTVKVTSGVQVQTSAGSFAACPSSGQLFFAARPNPTLYPNEIWSFDQEAPAAAQKRTALAATSYWSIYDLLLSPDCSRLLWSGGGGYNLRELWLLPTQGGALRKLPPAPSFIDSSSSFSLDQATVIYGGGGSNSTATVKALPVAPGSPVTLDSSAGAVHVFAVY